MSREVQVISGKMRQTFSEDEKRRIVGDSYASPLGLNQFARKMGISPASLSQWRKLFPKSAYETSFNSGVPFVPVSKLPIHEGKIMSFDEIFVHYEKLKSENEQLKAQGVSQELETLKAENAKMKAEFSHFKSYAMTKIFELEAPKYA
jgi:transposase-like protein